MIKVKKNIIENVDDKILYWFGLLFCICVFLATYRPSISNDTSFMILQAKNMLQNGIVHTDSYSMHQNLVYYPQKWLMNFIVLFFYNIKGFDGLIIGAYAISILKNTAIYMIVNYINKDQPIMNTIISAAAIYADGAFNDFRPYVLSIVFMILLIYALEQYIDKYNIRYLLFVPICSFLIMSIHSTMWLLFVICMLPYMLELSFIEKIIHNIGFKSIVITKQYDKRPIFIAFVMGILVAFFNPNGADQFVYIYKMMTGLGHSSFISEISPLTFANPFFKMWAMLMIIFVFSKLYQKVDLRFAYFFVGGCIMAAQAGRNFNYLILFSTLFVANVAKNSIKKPALKNNVVLSMFVIAGVIITTLLSGTILLMSDTQYQQKRDERRSIAVAKYFEENVNKDVKIFNSYGCGATLELFGFKPYIDERSEVFDININEKTDVLGEFYDFSMNPVTEFCRLQKKYEFDYVVMYKQSPINGYFKERKDIKKVYSDSCYNVYKIAK